MTKYIGNVAANLTPGSNHGFISLRTVRKQDGRPHGLSTRKDIFIHQADCDGRLRPGMEIEFEVYRDDTRANAYRADSAKETIGSRLVGLEQGGIELHLQNTQGGPNPRALEHSSVFVSWCLSAELADTVKHLKLGHSVVRLLLIWWPVVNTDYHDSSLEERKLVDVRDPMTFLSFSRGGLHRIVALVVWGDSETGLKDLYLKRTDDDWSTSVMSASGSKIVLESSDRSHRTNAKIFWKGSGLVQPEVPEMLFAKKPWDHEWLMFFNRKPLKDECDARRRRLLYAYHVQFLLLAIVLVILALSWSIAVIGALLLASFGFYRGINYRPILAPWEEPFWRIVDDIEEPTAFAFSVKGHRVGLPLAISPGALAIIAALTFFEVKSWSWLVFGWALGISAFLWAVACGIIFYLDSRDKQAAAEAKAKAEADAQARYAKQIEDELAGLICTPNAVHRRPDVSRLGISPSTVRFHALALKQRFCRGFARS